MLVLFYIGNIILQSYGHMVNISMLSKSWKQKSTYMYYTWISTLQSMFLFAVWSSDISLITSSLGTIRSVRPLAVGEEEKLLSLLGKMQKFYQYHGINLRTCYEDFDRHHMGVVTESQVKIILQLHVSVINWNFIKLKTNIITIQVVISFHWSSWELAKPDWSQTDLMYMNSWKCWYN